VRIAFVVQRCGLEVNGGAELYCLQVAQRMAKHCRVEIITTCALDYMTWQDFYPEAVQQIGPTSVRRFRVDRPRNVEQFDRLSTDLHARQEGATLPEQEVWMRAQGPMSTGLLDYLVAEKDAYDVFVFFTYLYATSYFGLPLVRDKALLVPLAHDEWPLYFTMWDRFFTLPKRMIFNTSAERDLLHRRFSGAALPGPVIGIGIEPPPEIASEKFKTRHNLTVPFLLYVGRVDESKGCRTMFDFFLRWKQAQAFPHKLVVLGKEIMPVPFHDDIVYAGFVGDDEKWAAMKTCAWLVMPSPHESLSMVTLETWSVGRPVLVNADCEVLVRHCQASNGGLWYSNFEEWSAVLTTVDEKKQLLLGRQGREYVQRHYTWDRIEAGYLDAFHSVLTPGQ
jgi:glycosyltransferase involved in cell wall biosynthesis